MGVTTLKSIQTVFLLILTCALLVACGSDDGPSGAAGGPGVIVPPRQGDPLAFTPTQISDGEVQSAYFQTFTATGGFQPYTFSMVGILPPGLAIGATGNFGGVPTQEGDYNFTIRLRDDMGDTLTQQYSMKIVANGMLPTISTPSIPTATFGGAYAVQLAVNGGSAPYTFSDDGGFPANIVLQADGLLSGVANVQGSFPVTLTVEDAFGARTMRSLTYEVTASQAGPQILTTQPAMAQLGQPYLFNFQATGATAPYSWSTPDPLPAGLMLASDGTLMGTPQQVGNTTFLIVVTDAANILTGVLVTVVVN